jgi:hypothetical protein
MSSFPLGSRVYFDTKYGYGKSLRMKGYGILRNYNEATEGRYYVDVLSYFPGFKANFKSVVIVPRDGEIIELDITYNTPLFKALNEE